MSDLKIVPKDSKLSDPKTDQGFRSHISQNRYSIMRQPVRCSWSNRVFHNEWLVRFDSEAGLSHILRPAEISGAISKLDLSMLQQAVDALNNKPERTSIAVNVSGASFSDPNFENRLFSSLAQLEVNPNKLLFELTETWHLEDLSPVIRILNILRERGHAICLDDIGAGAASIRYLRKLPADWLKIDGAFVSGAAQNAQELAVLEAVLTLRDGLDVKFIAEGIETQRLLNFAKKIGFDAVQGYLLGAPDLEELG